jgi:hypothetical protein
MNQQAPGAVAKDVLEIEAGVRHADAQLEALDVLPAVVNGLQAKHVFAPLHGFGVAVHRAMADAVARLALGGQLGPAAHGHHGQ